VGELLSRPGPKGHRTDIVAALRNAIFCRPFSTSNPADRVFFSREH
jgi:hypothetical protein